EIGQVTRVRPGAGGLLAAKHGPMTRMGAKGRSASGTSKAVAKRSSSQRSSKSGGLLFGDGEDSIRWPLKGKITSNYGRRWGRMHHGIDMAGRKGTRFGSALPGEVTFVGWKRGYGKTIIIKHDSLETLYAHC